MTWTDSVAREVLPNGLTVLVERDWTTSTVAVVTHVKAGYFDEPDEWVGIAHVLEHMFFKGTPERGPGMLARETQRIGGYLNAGTIYDKTVYYAVVPAAQDGLERAIVLQADALRNLVLDADELSREIEVIVQESKRKLDSPDAVTSETLYQLLFRVHRMQRWRIGTEEGLRRLTADDLRSYYTSRYTPGKVIVSLAGDLDVEHALDLARRAYGDWKQPEVEVPGSPPEPSQRLAVRRLLRGDVERPLAAVGWRTEGALHEDAPALDMAAIVLGDGRASWLARAVRTPGLASYVGCTHYTPVDVGVFELSLRSDPDRLEEAITRSLQLAAALGNRPVDEVELDRARALFATGWSRRLESADGRAALLAQFEALGDIGLADQYYDAVMEVSADDVHRIAERYLRPDVACAVIYVPQRMAAAWADDGWPPGAPSRAGPAALPSRTHSPGLAVSEVRASQIVDGIYQVPGDGADLLIKTKPGVGLVALGLHFPGLKNYENAESAGISWLLARTALRGAAGMKGEELAAAAERLGGTLGPAVGPETVGWAITVQADAARDAALLLRDVALAPTLADADLEIERDLQANDAARFRDDMYHYPLHGALHQAFPDDPYGLPALGEPDQVRGLRPAALREWAARLRATRPVVVAVGDCEPRELERAVGVFADWGGDGYRRPTDPPVWNPGRGEETRDKQQTALAMAFPAPTAASDDRFVVAVVCSVLSGLAGRLFDELRERRALAYTVHASGWLRHRAGAVLTYIATSPEREGEARDAMLAELERLTREPIAEEELERARNYAAGLVAIRRQHARAVALEIADGWLLGTLDELAHVEDRIRAVDADAVKRVGGELFDAGGRAEFVVRGAG